MNQSYYDGIPVGENVDNDGNILIEVLRWSNLLIIGMPTEEGLMEFQLPDLTGNIVGSPALIHLIWIYIQITLDLKMLMCKN